MIEHRDWVSFLKNSQIAHLSPADDGKLRYRRDVTDTDLRRFLAVKTDLSDEEIEAAIFAELGELPLANAGACFSDKARKISEQSVIAIFDLLNFASKRSTDFNDTGDSQINDGNELDAIIAELKQTNEENRWRSAVAAEDSSVFGRIRATAIKIDRKIQSVGSWMFASSEDSRLPPRLAGFLRDLLRVFCWTVLGLVAIACSAIILVLLVVAAVSQVASKTGGGTQTSPDTSPPQDRDRHVTGRPTSAGSTTRRAEASSPKPSRPPFINGQHRYEVYMRNKSGTGLKTHVNGNSETHAMRNAEIVNEGWYAVSANRVR